jgi:hypothetical protein
MTDVVRLDGDYRIVTKTGGEIRLDTGDNTGTVYITGNLEITGTGTKTKIDTTDLQIKDRIITLNDGQVGNKISGVLPEGNKSGFIIARSTDLSPTGNRASLLYDEDLPGISSGPRGGGDGAFVLRSDNRPGILYVGGLRLDTANMAPSFYPNGNPRFYFTDDFTSHVVLSIGPEASVQTYSADLLASGLDNDIPNKKYVDDRFAALSVGTDRARRLSDGSATDERVFIELSHSALGGAGRMAMFVDNYLVMQLEQNSVQMADLGVVGSTIKPVFTNTNLYLTTENADVEIQAGLSFTVPTYTPESETNKVKVYSTSTTGAGGTGLLFVNEQGKDELVSAKKALIFSIIF